jgi:hypothetical protein
VGFSPRGMLFGKFVRQLAFFRNLLERVVVDML